MSQPDLWKSRSRFGSGPPRMPARGAAMCPYSTVASSSNSKPEYPGYVSSVDDDRLEATVFSSRTPAGAVPVKRNNQPGVKGLKVVRLRPRCVTPIAAGLEFISKPNDLESISKILKACPSRTCGENLITRAPGAQVSRGCRLGQPPCALPTR